MNKHIVLCMTFTAAAAFAQPPNTSGSSAHPGTGDKLTIPNNNPCAKPPGCPTPSHSSEPIIIGDGSVKLSFYGEVDKGPDGRTLIAQAGKAGHSGTFVVASGVNSNGQVNTVTGVHPSAAILSYRYEVESWDAEQHKWLPYAFIDFSNDTSAHIWRISPYPTTALDLSQDGPKVPNPPGYPNHTLTRYEYRKDGLRLRIGWVWANGADSAWRTPLATGCSAYRIEPSDHLGPAHAALEHPCPSKRATPGKAYAAFTLGAGLKAIDISEDVK